VIFFFAACFNLAFGQDDLQIWKEFVDVLRNGKITVDHIRPYEQLGDKFKPILLGFLDSVRTQALPIDRDVEPEIIRTDNRIQYLIPLTSRTQKVTYCFSCITEGAQWYFQHLEAIFIRLDKLAKLPTSEFPDVSEAQKNWAREEIYWSFVITNFYLPTVKEKGKPFFALYFTAAHLKPRISLDDYKQIFETIWQDRAQNSGWNMEIQYDTDFEVTFHFKR
jgi:hypothetical protein